MTITDEQLKELVGTLEQSAKLIEEMPKKLKATIHEMRDAEEKESGWIGRQFAHHPALATGATTIIGVGAVELAKSLYNYLAPSTPEQMQAAARHGRSSGFHF